MKRIPTDLQAAYDEHRPLARAGREDCAFSACQLSAGHPLPHCVPVPGGGRYAMVDDDGNVLREL